MHHGRNQELDQQLMSIHSLDARPAARETLRLAAEMRRSGALLPSQAGNPVDTTTSPGRRTFHIDDEDVRLPRVTMRRVEPDDSDW